MKALQERVRYHRKWVEIACITSKVVPVFVRVLVEALENGAQLVIAQHNVRMLQQCVVMSAEEEKQRTFSVSSLGSMRWRCACTRASSSTSS